jgi:hypothetical protein
MSADQRDPRDEVAPLNADGSGLQELGEGDLEEAAGGMTMGCDCFTCNVYDPGSWDRLPDSSGSSSS